MIYKVLFLLWKNRVGTWLHIAEKNLYGISSPVIFNRLLLFILMPATPSFFLVTFFLNFFLF